MATVQVTDSNLEQFLKSSKLVLVDFWAPWCGPCRMIAPILEELSGIVGENVVIAKLNVDENPLSAGKYRIQGIPTMKLFRNGVEIETFVGVQPLNRLKAAIMQHA